MINTFNLACCYKNSNLYSTNIVRKLSPPSPQDGIPRRIVFLGSAGGGGERIPQGIRSPGPKTSLEIHHLEGQKGLKKHHSNHHLEGQTGLEKHHSNHHLEGRLAWRNTKANHHLEGQTGLEKPPSGFFAVFVPFRFVHVIQFPEDRS